MRRGGAAGELGPPSREPYRARMERSPLGGARALFVALAWALAVGCPGPLGPAPNGEDGGQEPLDAATITTLAWVGSYDGFGTVSEDGVVREVSELTLRIAFDADSIRGLQCPHCVTVALEPWFSRGNLEITAPAETFLSYSVDGVTRSLTMNRFSGAGGTSNTVLAQLRYERPEPTGTVTLLEASFQFFAR